MMRTWTGLVVTVLLCAAASPVAQSPSDRASSDRARSDRAPTATIERIAALLERADLATAKAEAAPALVAYPSDPDLHNLAGVVDAQQGAYASAEAHFLTAIRLAPRAAAPYTNLGRLYQERSAVEPGAREKALDVYRRLLAVEPSNVEGLYQSGFLLALDGAFSESRTFIMKLPEDVRANPQVLAVVATDLHGLGDAQGHEPPWPRSRRTSGSARPTWWPCCRPSSTCGMPRSSRG